MWTGTEKKVASQLNKVFIKFIYTLKIEMQMHHQSWKVKAAKKKRRSVLKPVKYSRWNSLGPSCVFTVKYTGLRVILHAASPDNKVLPRGRRDAVEMEMEMKNVWGRELRGLMGYVSLQWCIVGGEEFMWRARKTLVFTVSEFHPTMLFKQIYGCRSELQYDWCFYSGWKPIYFTTSDEDWLID